MSSAQQPARVVVLGDVMTDVIARVDDPLALGSDTAAHVRTHQGGAGANVAAWLGELGVSVLFVGRVGDDPFGHEAVQRLASAGVQSAVAIDARQPTGTVVVLVGADGERTMLPDAGANSTLEVTDLPLPALRRAQHVHVSGYTLLNPGSRAAGSQALAVAAGARVLTSVDAASAAPLEALGGKEFLRLTEDVDIAFCTQDEAEVLVGSRDPDVAMARLTATYRTVVLKLGAAGACWASDGHPRVQVPATAAPSAVIDSTGAGDAFAAGYLASCLASAVSADPTLVAATLRSGCDAAARAVVTAGARPSSSPNPDSRR